MTFVQVLATLRHWLREHNIDPRDDEPRFRVIIEVPTPRLGVAVLHTLKSEIEPMMNGPLDNIYIGQPMRIGGFDVEFVIKDDRPLPAVYWHEFPGFGAAESVEEKS
jgi:ABC-type nitrate/sulfonate/bicarbonate transport system substrate-binding protein